MSLPHYSRLSGMAMLADTYKDEAGRGRAMGISFSGLALGLIAGAPFGSVMYQFVGKMSPFLILAVIAVLGGGLHLLIFTPSQAEMHKGSPFLILLRDPYIVIASGVVFLPDRLSYLIALNIFGHLSQKVNGRRREAEPNRVSPGFKIWSSMSAMSTEVPFFVADLDSMFRMHLKWRTNLPRVTPFYALKCNNMPAVVQMLRALGTGFDCASKGEIEQALSLGVKPEKIIYAHTTKPTSHIRYACSHGVNRMTFDSEDELLKISQCHPKAKLVLRIAVDDSKALLRLNLKFGAKLGSVGKLLERARELDLEVIGVSFHVGSGCTECGAFMQAIADARQVFDTASLMGFQMSLLDIGGGFSGREDFHVKFEEFTDVINDALEKYFPPDSGVQIIAEPGRYYVESVFTLAASVIARRVITDDVKEIYNADEKNPDKVMMYYLNDGVFGSLNCLIFDAAHSVVKPYLHRVVDSSEKTYPSVVWGPTCDSLDKVTDSLWFPELQIGDWLLVDHMGAYSVTSATDFNGFERPTIFCVISAKVLRAVNLSSTFDIVHE